MTWNNPDEKEWKDLTPDELRWFREAEDAGARIVTDAGSRVPRHNRRHAVYHVFGADQGLAPDWSPDGYIRQKTIYLAGPMRGYPHYNFRAFDDAAEGFESDGWRVLNPAAMDREAGFNAYELPDDHDWSAIPTDYGFSFEACVDRDIAALRRSDAVYLLNGWENSVGARAEKALAEWLGLDIVYESPPAPVDAETRDNGQVRVFETGATRDTDEGKLDFDGFLSPYFLRAFAEYMHRHRVQSDGQLRASDNWQRGIPREQYRKSAWRHFFDWWRVHRTGGDPVELACALFFNIQGDTHEYLKTVQQEAA